MPIDFIVGLILNLVDLLRMSLIITIPTFLIVLVGQKINLYIKEKYNLSWSVSAFSTTAIILTPIVFALYLIPYGLGFASAGVTGPAPEFMQLTILDYAMALISTIVKNVISIILFTILLMPLLFIASFIGEKIEEKKQLPKWFHTFVTIFATTFVAWIIVFALDYVGIGLISAIFWKLYWSPI